MPEPPGGNLSGVEREQLDAQRVGAAAALAFGSGALMVREDPGERGSTLAAGGPGARGQGGAGGRRRPRSEGRREGARRCSGPAPPPPPAVTAHLSPPAPPPAAGHVRAAARRPVHLSVRAGGQSADQRGRAARAGVPAAEPRGAAPPAPDGLLRSLQGGRAGGATGQGLLAAPPGGGGRPEGPEGRTRGETGVAGRGGRKEEAE